MKLTFTAAEVNKLIVRDLQERNLVREGQVCTVSYMRSKAEQMLISVDISAPASTVGETSETQPDLFG